MRRKLLVPRAALASVALLIILGGPRPDIRVIAQAGKPDTKVILPVFEVDPQFPAMPERMLANGAIDYVVQRVGPEGRVGDELLRFHPEFDPARDRKA